MSTTTLPRVLVVLGVVLLVAPALVPVQPVLYHDTRPGTVDNRSQLEARGYEVVAYGNLSQRGQDLYVRALQERGEYTVPVGQGAPEFPYRSPAEIRESRDYRDRQARTTIVVERPPDAQLPPADEPVYRAEHMQERDQERKRGGEAERTPGDGDAGSGGGDQRGTDAEGTRQTADDRSVEEWRQQIARFDVVETRTDRPPLDAPASLLRLLSAVGGVLAIGVGGYLRAQP